MDEYRRLCERFGEDLRYQGHFPDTTGKHFKRLKKRDKKNPVPKRGTRRKVLPNTK